ncbi:ATP-binding protein [Streptomyces sp. NPDC047990]|uniref:ATP-binding protein n=1 Tax=Streptomyces sp. NPDC047990 TaxID=3365496 RepID=UPI00372292A8
MNRELEQRTEPDTQPADADRGREKHRCRLSPPAAAQVFVREIRAAQRARRFVAHTLESWGVTERTDDVVLCATELAANAIQHTRYGTDQFLVRVLLRRGTLRVEVHDSDPRPPTFKNPGAGAQSGRGLILISGLADGCGVDLKPSDGKAVWADFDLSGLTAGHRAAPAAPDTDEPATAPHDGVITSEEHDLQGHYPLSPVRE